MKIKVARRKETFCLKTLLIYAFPSIIVKARNTVGKVRFSILIQVRRHRTILRMAHSQKKSVEARFELKTIWSLATCLPHCPKLIYIDVSVIV